MLAAGGVCLGALRWPAGWIFTTIGLGAYQPSSEAASLPVLDTYASSELWEEGEPPELVHVPYSEVRDPDFVAGYYEAYDYFVKTFDHKGMYKVCELTDRDLVKEVVHLFKEGR